MSQKKADKAAGSAAKSPRPKNAWEEQEAEPDVEEKGEEELLGSSLVQELDDVEDKPAPETTDEIVPKKEKTRSKKKKNAFVLLLLRLHYYYYYYYYYSNSRRLRLLQSSPMHPLTSRVSSRSGVLESSSLSSF